MKPTLPNISAVQRGFSLLEVMVVIFIIGLLATVVMVNVLPSQGKAMKQKARADIRMLEQAVEMYRLDLRQYPTTEQGLDALRQEPADLARPELYQDGGYIKRLPEDPWGNPYQYVYPGDRAEFEIFSLGADGRIGGEDENADIGNWQEEAAERS